MTLPNQLSFFDLRSRYEALSRQGDPLERLATLIPWETFRPRLAKALRRSKRRHGGRPPFDAVLMFKVLVLQALYHLSDEQTEYQIRDRLSFMRFLGLDLHGRVPDAKTIWLFRETLTQAKAIEPLFSQFGRVLDGHGLQAVEGQIIDASLVAVPTQRNSREENATLKAGERPAAWASQLAKQRQKDTDARWTVKGGVSHYGYKNHVGIDRRHKLIRSYAVTHAAVHDSQVLEVVLDPANTSPEVWADAAYRSAPIEAQLQAQGYRSRIQRKGSRAQRLSARQQATNRRWARIRARVEHVFGHQVTAMQGTLIRTIGLVRAQAKIGLKNLTYNLHRFAYLLTTANRPTTGAA